MPRPRRTTKAAKSKEPAAAMSEEDEERLNEIPLLLRDFEKELAEMCKEIEDTAKSVDNRIKTKYKISLSKLAASQRNILIETFSAKAEETDSENSESGHDQSLDISQRVSTIKSTVKNSTRKRKMASAKKMYPGSAVRRSNRKGSSVVEETPLQANFLCPPRYPPAGLGRTPFITPKFNTMTPLTRTLHRQARPNETLVSLSGSPVMAATVAKGRGKAVTSEAMNFAQIPLGENLTLNLPFLSDFEHDGLDLDEDQLNKLALIQQGLTNMLKGRTASSSSE